MCRAMNRRWVASTLMPAIVILILTSFSSSEKGKLRVQSHMPRYYDRHDHGKTRFLARGLAMRGVRSQVQTRVCAEARRHQEALREHVACIFILFALTCVFFYRELLLSEVFSPANIFCVHPEHEFSREPGLYRKLLVSLSQTYSDFGLDCRSVSRWS